MIRPLRQRHLRVMFALGFLLPPLLAVGLVGRRPAPASTGVPLVLSERASSFGPVLWSRADLWADPDSMTLLRRDASGRDALELRLSRTAHPDLLVYWLPGNEPPPADLPPEAQWLGVVSPGRPLPVPPAWRGQSGRLLLYSLAHHQLISTSQVLTLSTP